MPNQKDLYAAMDQAVNIYSQQMDRLLQVQQEIERKNRQDRLESEKLNQELIESNRRMNMRMQSTSPYSSVLNQQRNTIKMSIQPSPANIAIGKSDSSGNIRLESQFIERRNL